MSEIEKQTKRQWKVERETAGIKHPRFLFSCKVTVRQVFSWYTKHEQLRLAPGTSLPGVF